LANLLGNLTQQRLTASAVDSAEISTALFASENPKKNEHHALNNAIIVHCFFEGQKNVDDLNEFQLLAKSAQAEILTIITGSRSSPQAKYFVGQGKAEEIADALVSEGFESVEEVAYVPASELLEVEGFDAELAESLRAKAREVVLKAAEEAEAKLNEIDEDLRTLDGVDEDMLRDLAEANITSRDDLAELSIAELIEITGVSHEEAEKAILAARAHWFAEEDNA